MATKARATSKAKRCGKPGCTTTQLPHDHCKMCGYPVQPGGGICGECACEDDCAP